MDVLVDRLGKRFNRKWIFRNLSTRILSGQKLAVAGPNGSGKSTLLKILAGALPQSEGTCSFFLHDRTLKEDEVPRQITFTGPYMELIDELTLREHMRFHTRFRKLRTTTDYHHIPEILGKNFNWEMPVRTMSSGMMQRLKLYIALCTEARVVFLDEPTTNLDEEGKAWFESTLADHCVGSTVIIASNDPFDHRSCTERIFLPDY
jgi:ABC-type multidrug transport system ATPase subunit